VRRCEENVRVEEKLQCFRASLPLILRRSALES
jgi:hypothetical protein